MEHVIVIEGVRYIKNGRISDENGEYEVLTPISDSELSDLILKVVKKNGIETYERLDEKIIQKLQERYE